MTSKRTFGSRPRGFESLSRPFATRPFAAGPIAAGRFAPRPFAAPSTAVQREKTPDDKHDRTLEPDEEETSEPDEVVQRAVDNNYRALHRRIRITNPNASDYGDEGVIERDSQYRDYFAVRFDNSQSGALYRVHYKEMDYLDTAPRLPVQQTQPSVSNNNNNNNNNNEDALWTPIKGGEDYQNCTDFAFEQDAELCFEPDLKKLLILAAQKGYVQVTDPTQATVVLYGQGSNYSHAIRRVGRVWQEVQSMGGQMREFTGPNPPRTHSGDVIVAMLRKT